MKKISYFIVGGIVATGIGVFLYLNKKNKTVSEIKDSVIGTPVISSPTSTSNTTTPVLPTTTPPKKDTVLNTPLNVPTINPKPSTANTPTRVPAPATTTTIQTQAQLDSYLATLKKEADDKASALRIVQEIKALDDALPKLKTWGTPQQWGLSLYYNNINQQVYIDQTFIDRVRQRWASKYADLRAKLATLGYKEQYGTAVKI